MEALLTRGAVAPAAQRAVLQVVEVSWVAEPPVGLDGCCLCRPSTETHRKVLSDGVHTLGQFSLSTPLKHYVEDGHIRKGTVLRLLVFCCNVCSTDKTIIYEFEVL
ncbi:hypothetical protein PAHAL_6G227300 [Panicum hallii]|uniref:Replication factor-A protein 1 N-terminal domain-containing protein n=1 Tax=Panicum hallii TaxID=206008 RepID=A0A2T8IHE5_9POAL|nr:hypothetical protein PAHAL_6G227300 [Panicum hallii]